MLSIFYHRQNLIKICRGLVEEMRISVTLSLVILFAGICSILLVFQGHREWSFFSFGLGVVLHALRPKPIKGEAFSQSIHSLSQLVTFGTVPGIMLNNTALSPNSFFVWVCIGIFVSACAIQLTHKNMRFPSKVNKRMSVAAGGSLLAMYALFVAKYSIILTTLFVLLLSLLIVFPIRERNYRM
ncbi:CDP-alcohol phosphatidyltransferase family protein [Paenibacillus xylanivorans]|uniref:Uncharacterized protein n=1 Tax=Paenibacillus xylanivorans TaxID=1705561 RepID=A0A0M9BM40_9BACL|nr:hypothetical protein [Paenibacillus xylanivorans]KOY14769.1 hypothetical protein AMS66_19745 [Paenibacillus xylanivorans]